MEAGSVMAEAFGVEQCQDFIADIKTSGCWVPQRFSAFENSAAFVQRKGPQSFGDRGSVIFAPALNSR
jgi:hypothetical protein